MVIRKTKQVTKLKEPKFKPLRTIEMEVAIAKYFNPRQNIIVPNISWGFLSHEADLYIIRPSGYAVEVEIKISKSDFLADFKKKHNHNDKGNHISEFYYAIPIKLYDECVNLIPKDAGILVCEKYYDDIMDRTYINVRTKRKAIRIKNAKKLTEKEISQISRLGSMRIWNLKNRIIKLQEEKDLQNEKN